MGKLVLLVEDDPQIADVYQIAFKSAKISSETITMGLDAIERIKKIKEAGIKKPDLIILDLILPDINGIEVLQEIRKFEEAKDIPVFILTNYSSDELKKMGYDLSSEQFLLKSDYTPSKLVELVKSRLE
jgi:DNA-binding response OmpR family regulator